MRWDYVIYSLRCPRACCSAPPILEPLPASSVSIESDDPEDLVEIRPAPPLPNATLEALYRAGLEAYVDDDLERAEILWGQVLAQDASYQDGTLPA